MLSVVNQPFMLSLIMLSDFMVNVIMLSVIVLSVVAPQDCIFPFPRKNKVL
jgi:hypothetical protein